LAVLLIWSLVEHMIGITATAFLSLPILSCFLAHTHHPSFHSRTAPVAVLCHAVRMPTTFTTKPRKEYEKAERRGRFFGFLCLGI
jgi:hypothetical protein